MPHLLFHFALALVEMVAPRLARVQPEVWTVGRRVYARTCFVERLIRLFAFSRWVCVDGVNRAVEIRRRWFWVFTTKRIVWFDQIDHLDTHYEGRPSSLRSKDEGDPVRDLVRISAVLKESRREIELLRFAALSFDQDRGGGLLPGREADEGELSPDGRAFQTFLSGAQRTIGVTIGPAFMESIHGDGPRLECGACGRVASPAWRRCIYCGGEIVEVSDA